MIFFRNKKLLIISLAVVLLGIIFLIRFIEDVVKQPPEINDSFLLGQYYFNQDQEGEYNLKLAREHFYNTIAASSTSNNLVWYQLGRIDFLEGKFDEAIYKFNKQLEYFSEEVPNVYYMLGLTYGYKARLTNSESDWQKGEEGFQNFLRLTPTSPWAATDLAWIYFSQGKYEDMLPVLELSLDSNPDNPWVHNMYGLALLNTAALELAKVHFTKAKEEADKLTVQDWGAAYPGNNPTYWQAGLDSFKDAINQNLELINSSLDSE